MLRSFRVHQPGSGEVAGRHVFRANAARLRHLVNAHVLSICAAGMKRTSRGRVCHVWRRAGDRPRGGVRKVEARHRIHQAHGIGMLGIVEKDINRGSLNDPAGVHDRDPVSHLRDHPEVMGDQQDAHAVLLLEIPQQGEYLGLNRHVERGRRLVRDEEIWAR